MKQEYQLQILLNYFKNIMENSLYQLRINVDKKYYEIVTSILELENVNYKRGWSFDIILENEPTYYNVFDKFLNILQNKYEQLLELGIKKNDISFWLIYGYNNQCNMEFSSVQLKRIGENEITLCISCYEMGS